MNVLIREGPNVEKLASVLSYRMGKLPNTYLGLLLEVSF